MLVGIAAAAAAGGLELAPETRWVEDLDIRLGQQRISLEDGYLFPIRIEASEAVAGFLFVGDARVKLPVWSAGERLRLAAALQEPVSDEPWRTEDADLLLVVTRDRAATDPIDALPVLIPGDETTRFIGENGQENLIVTHTRPNRARALAQRTLAARSSALAEVSLDPVAMLARDGFLATPRFLVEARPTRSWRGLYDAAGLDRDPDTWITVVGDPQLAVDDRYTEVVAIHGGSAGGRRFRTVAGCPSTAPAERIAAREVVENVVIEPSVGLAHDVTLETLVLLEAERDTQLLDLWLPRFQPHTESSEYTTPPRFEIDAIEIDGAPVDLAGAVWGPRRPPGDWWSATLVLDRPVGPDHPARMRIRWRERWPSAHLFEYQAGPSTVVIDLGMVHVGQEVVPLLGAARQRVPAEIRVGTTLPRAWSVVLSGSGESVPAGDGRWWTWRGLGASTVSVGKLDAERLAAATGEEVVVHTHDIAAELAPAQVASVLAFYEPLLGPHPYDTVTVVQADRIPMSPYRHKSPPTVVPGLAATHELHAMKELGSGPPGPLSQTRQLNRIWPHALERSLAYTIAADHWFDRPWARADRWMAGSLPALYSDRYARAELPLRDEDAWRRYEASATAEAPDGPMAPWDWSEGPWRSISAARLLSDAIAERVGEQVMLDALRTVADSEERSTAAVIAEIERASGVPLLDWVDSLAVAGLRPAVEGTVTPGDDGLRVVLTADPPYGRFELPVRTEGPEGAATHWVEVIDGHGEAVIAAPADSRLALDPDGWFPLRRRALRRTDG